jgi:mRNA interferase RelE/StbE
VTDYAVVVSDRATREIEDLPANVAARVYMKLATLGSQPLPHGVKKLSGGRDLWRIRVGDYRVIYSVDDRARAVDVIRVRHRSKAYD